MKTICWFFIVIFSSFIIASSALVILEENTDISIFYSVTEEEQNGEERKIAEKHTKILNKFLTLDLKISDHSIQLIQPNIFLDWASVYFELHSPPPEYI